MNKLQHSISATKRTLQMSDYQLFVFVEGTSDKYFYGEICNVVCNNTLKYHVYEAEKAPFCKDEIRNKKLSGKSGVLALFTCFNENSLLTVEFKGRKKVAVFFLDKDVDDLLDKKIDSGHLIYTKHYDVENHIFMEGNVIKGAASATDMTAQEVHEKILNPHDWTFQVAKKWGIYVKLCFFAVKTETTIRECQYGREILPPTFNSTCESDFLTNQDYLECSALLDKLYDQHEHNLVFKGKWYAGLLDRELTNKAGKHEKILSCIQTTLDFKATWAEHFKQPLRKLLAKL